MFFAGKGGVGKSTIAAATAVRAARLGMRTRLVSTDGAHSLGDVLDVDVGDVATEVEPGLVVSEPDARRRLEADWEPVRAFLERAAARSGASVVHAAEVMVVPGLDEVFALAAVAEAARDPGVDLVVVDCAPTAETVRMLALPEVLGWWLNRLRPVVVPAQLAVGPSFEQLTGMAMPGVELLGALERIAASLGDAGELLADVGRVGHRLVTLPNAVVTAETRRLHSYLSLFGGRVDAIIVNQLLGDTVGGGGAEDWRQAEGRQVDELVGDVAPVPVLTATRSVHEVRGPDALHDLAVELYGDEDPSIRHVTRPTMRWELDGAPTLLLDLPGADRDDVELSRTRSDLVVTLGPHRRHVALIDSVLGRPIAGAEVRDGVLRVHFAGA